MKWPNDIEIEGRKVCGILIEIPRDHDRCVLGIGVNVNNSFHDASQAFSSRAASLRDLTGKSLPLYVMLSSIVTKVLRHVELLDQDDPQLPARWHDACCLKGSSIRVKVGSQKTEGLCEGIGRDGALLVRRFPRSAPMSFRFCHPVGMTKEHAQCRCTTHLDASSLSSAGTSRTVGTWQRRGV